MSFVTFIRDYVQDPDKIVSIPNLVFDTCKEFVWYIFTFQWFRNLTYVTLSYPEGVPLASPGVTNPSTTAISSPSVIQSQLLDQKFLETCRENIDNFLSQSTNQIQNFCVLTNNDSLLNTSFESNLLKGEQLSYFHNFLYGFSNGIISNFHFCAVTILIIHVLLNENKERAFRITLATCFGDISYVIAILLGYRGIIAPWLVLEPLSYLLGFVLQFLFALEIIKDNTRIKANFDRQFDRKSILTSNDSFKFITRGDDAGDGGQLSFNRWLIPSLVLFSWCEQTQIFQTGGQFSLQPTATLLEMSYPGGIGLNSMVSQSGIGFEKELQIIIYLSTFIFTRITTAWFCLSIFQSLINWKNINSGLFGLRSKDSSIFSVIKKLPFNIVSFYHKLLIRNERQKIAFYIKNSLSQLFWYGINKITNLFLSIKSLFIPKSLQKQTNFTNNLKSSAEESLTSPKSSVLQSENALQAKFLLNSQKRKGLQHVLRDPLAIAAVTCSLAFLPAYSTNLLITKSVGFFPEENRTKHSLFSPWDMPATVLASDMDFISNHPNHAEYPFFLPFYDKGDYGGWLGIGEEDIRYGPFRLWQSRRIRAPWRKTTLQEPALTFANDKSLFINPLLRTPNLKNSSTQGEQDTANIKNGVSLSPLTNINKWLMRKEISQPDTVIFGSDLKVDTASIGDSKIYGKQKWDHLWKQFKIQSAYTKLLAINNVKSGLFFKQTPTVNLVTSDFGFTKSDQVAGEDRITEGSNAKVFSNTYDDGDASDKNYSTRNLSSLHSFASPSATLDNSLIEKHKDLYSQKIIKTQNLKLTKAGRKKLVEVLKKPLRKLATSSFFNITNNESSYSEGMPINVTKDSAVTNQETKIKYSKQIRKRFKKFKKKLRLFRTRAYKKRNTRIKKLKHFNSLKNKKKKHRKSRRLIYKLRRQYPYVRNIKQRKGETFGLYSSAHNFSPISQQGLEQLHPSGVNGTSNKVAVSEKMSYLTEYPNNKNSINSKKDFNLIFRTQMGERLDFAQEEIRARIFINPYVRFLLNNRIDNLISRSTSVGNNSAFVVKSSSSPITQRVTTSPSATASSKVKKSDLFKRRLLISKYADAVDFLKPSLHHSYVDRVYNHQFKGTLSTARRLFSLKIQYDQPLIHSSKYKPAIKHEGLLDSLENQNINDGITFGDNNSNLLEKNYSAPLYGAWDPQLQKLILTNRYLNYKKATTSATSLSDSTSPTPRAKASIQAQHRIDNNDNVDTQRVLENIAITKGDGNGIKDVKLLNQKSTAQPITEGDGLANNNLIVFTHWPLKESYFKDNEFLVSQLYSNSQPIDSFLSQENEKARPVALPRRVNSLNTVLNSKNDVQPTDAQRSQQFLKLENNDKKTFLFKHFWNYSNTANELFLKQPASLNSLPSKFRVPNTLINIGAEQFVPISAEQRKTTRVDEREYPLWMVLRALPPNQGGFLWPGD